MPDPQDGIKRWFAERLAQRGSKAHAELSKLLSVSIDAVRRMRNLDGAKESRRIEAQHIPIMAEYFGEWPPGFTMTSDDESKPEFPAKEVNIDSGGGCVTVIDKSINVIGDSAVIRSSEQGIRGDLLGKINVAIDEIYRSAGKNISLEQLGQLAFEQYHAIAEACQDEEEYPYAIEIMKIRLKKIANF